jgi:hypothetical protein
MKNQSDEVSTINAPKFNARKYPVEISTEKTPEKFPASLVLYHEALIWGMMEVATPCTAKFTITKKHSRGKPGNIKPLSEYCFSCASFAAYIEPTKRFIRPEPAHPNIRTYLGLRVDTK